MNSTQLKETHKSELGFNPLDPEFQRNPWPVLKQARDAFPVYIHENYETRPVSVTRYEDVQRILTEWKLYSSDMGQYFRDRNIADANILIGQDPPLHTKVREAVNKAFRPAYIRRLEDYVMKRCNELFDEVIDRDEFDIVEDFAGKLTVALIGRLAGLPPEDQPLIRDWTNRLSAIDSLVLFTNDNSQELELVRTTTDIMGQMDVYFEEQLKRFADTHDDSLVNAMKEAKLEHQEIKAFLKLLVFAGNETTTNLINNTVRLLIDYPDQQSLLRANHQLTVQTVEEVLRFEGSAHTTFRRSVEDHILHDVEIGEDQYVLVWLVSANRDERAFQQAEEFDISRVRQRQLAFGYGIHACLGSALARLEARIALDTILKKTKSIERTCAEMEPIPGITINGTWHQWVRFHPA